uniref:Rv1355c family protein n=1 Tax=Mycobacterium sp. TaxID=1785 RepID=UPI002620D377
MDKPDVTAYTAQVLDPDESDDRVALQRLRADPNVAVIDQLDAQLANLRSLRPPVNPELLGERTRWANYPWRRAVVAVLGPRGYSTVRLDRNRNNITAQEQARLSALRIGVAGLSVGHVIAHTLAAQGLCGHLRLADFDHLELSNLNRVPATVFDLGINKAYVAARRVAELDPYLTLEVFDAGLTVDTVDVFVEGLDIVIEECDSLDMKAALRQAARARGVPVLMATSDRGLIDVERFDKDPLRPLLHGLLSDLEPGLLPDMSSGEKVRHVLRLLEAERLSPRGAASLIEVDRSLTTWPQLASDVVLGAAALAEAVRRIGLGESLRSGRTRIDIGWALNQLGEPTMDEHRPLATERQETARLAGIPGVIASAAIRAPSGGNVQPWHIHATPTSPALINPHILPALTAVIMRSLAKDPTARHPSASALLIAVTKAFNIPTQDLLSQSGTLMGTTVNIAMLNATAASLDPMNSPTYLSPLPQALQNSGILPALTNQQAIAQTPSSRVPNPATPYPPINTGGIPTITGATQGYQQPQWSQPLPAISGGPPSYSGLSGPIPQQQQFSAPMQPVAPPPARKPDRRWLIIGSAILLLLVVGSTLAYLYMNMHGTAAGTPVVGHVYFVNSGQLHENTTKGIVDRLQVALSNIPDPQPNKSY